MDIIAIIPARMDSTRLPGKMLLEKQGKPLVQHVYERVKQARRPSRVVVAADDARIRAAVSGFGGECVLTRTDHPNGSSRLAEAAAMHGASDDTLIVNVQGDEPDIDPAAIDAAISRAETSDAPVATLASPFGTDEDAANPNIVKVVVGVDGHALYFSRSMIPHHRAGGVSHPPLKHIGLYTYRAGFLRTYIGLAPTPLEQSEMLEQLRILEHGYRIAVAVFPASSQGIDTREQYEAWLAH